jgi:hypothetical protein
MAAGAPNRHMLFAGEPVKQQGHLVLSAVLNSTD